MAKGESLKTAESTDAVAHLATASIARKFGRAVKVDAEAFRRLDRILASISSTRSYSAELIDETSLRFASLDALLGYENSKNRAIKSIRINAGVLYDGHVTVEISSETGFTPAVRLRGEGPDDQMSKVVREVQSWLGDVEKGVLYSTFARQSTYSFSMWLTAVLFLGLVSWASMRDGFRLSQPVPKTEPTGVIVLIIIAAFASMSVLGYLLNKLRAAYWPVASFVIGLGAKREEDRHVWRLVWIAGALLSGIIGVVVNLLV